MRRILKLKTFSEKYIFWRIHCEYDSKPEPEKALTHKFSKWRLEIHKKEKFNYARR